MIYSIPAEQLPSHQYSVQFREPTFKDRREAMRRMPNDGSTVGYGLEQLMLALCLEGVNNIGANTQYVRDPIAKIREFTPGDTQFLISVFLEMFLLSKEGVDDAKALADKLKAEAAINYTIPAESMPGGFSVSFRAPSTGDQIDIDRIFPGADSGCGYDISELMFCSCVTHINGQQVDAPVKDQAINLVDSWSFLDVQFAVAVFLNLNFIDNTAKSAARELGKLLKQKGSATPPTASRKKGTSTEQASA